MHKAAIKKCSAETVGDCQKPHGEMVEADNKKKDKEEEDKSFSNISQYNPRQTVLMITVKKVLTFIFYIITILFDIFNNRTFRDHPYQNLNSIDYI
jgi:hypothetical protein